MADRILRKQKASRPSGAYNAVQPTNLAAERERFLCEAAAFEEVRALGPRRCTPRARSVQALPLRVRATVR